MTQLTALSEFQQRERQLDGLLELRKRAGSWEVSRQLVFIHIAERERSVEVPLESSVAHVCKNYCPELEKEPLEMVSGNYHQC